jgi:hypothetical protein
MLFGPALWNYIRALLLAWKQREPIQLQVLQIVTQKTGLALKAHGED